MQPHAEKGNHDRDAQRLGSPGARALRRGLGGAAGLLLAGGLGAGARAGNAAGQGQGRHSDLAGRRPVATGHLRSEAGSGLRLLRSVEQTDPHQRARNQHRRNAPLAGEAGRQVFHHPQHDPRLRRPRDGRLHRPDGMDARRPAGLSGHGRGGFAVQGLRRRLHGADSALYRGDRLAGTVFGSRVHGIALQTVCHRRQSGAQAVCRGRDRRAGYLRPAAAGPARSAGQAEHAGTRPAGQRPAWRPSKRRKNRPTT